ncbi:hypothetical protein N7539_006999 [Penicillium diatomitis]|uniref:Arylamine N-acetyltransferase n=1 Tax=Penicillium diatomitis TaxID=2819901 RepID=A0A9W9X2L8_9EURO|nr:uncharacterized protein N7539_006999 [Penicillium diatomitis]KAJ5481105.1 hypothetical protein N7539_006999 [Penicillium diatomitis]
MTQLPLDDESRTRYSNAELHAYFERIKLPQKYRDSIVLKDPTQALTKQHGLPLLVALTRHHTCNVPFENLVLHYTSHKAVTLDLTALFQKFVRRQLGGRCMENNSFFATVLRSLGYEVRNCAGRVSRAMSPYTEVRRNQGDTYDGWNHMLNLVWLEDEWYVTDVGMGAMGPNLPYPLRDGFETVSVAPREIRIQHRPIAETYTSRSGKGPEPPKLWCYDICYKPDDEAGKKWLPVYCFTETEFLPQDYEVMSWYTSKHPRSFFTKEIMCTKMIMDEGLEVIVGNLTLFNHTLTKAIGAERTMVKECKTEEDRLQVLEEMMQVHLTDEEKNSISDDQKLGHVM